MGECTLLPRSREAAHLMLDTHLQPAGPYWLLDVRDVDGGPCTPFIATSSLAVGLVTALVDGATKAGSVQCNLASAIR